MNEIGVGATSVKADPANLTDVQTGQAFFPSLPRLLTTLDAVTTGTTAVRSLIAPSKEPTKAQVNQSRNTVWSWVWLVNPPAVKWYAGWGFYFPTPGDEWHDLCQPSPEGSYFFVSIEADINISRPIQALNKQGLPSDWIVWPRKGLIKIFPLLDSVASGAELTSKLTRWTEERLEEIWPTVKALAETS